MSKQEASNIIHNLLPHLEAVNIPILNIRVDAATKKTSPLRGDVWISKEPSSSNKWEKNIIGLIEVKSKHTTVGSRDWNDAIRQGKLKAEYQELPYFVVTNTDTIWKYYRTKDAKEITLDGNPINSPLGLYDLGILFTQISVTKLNAKKDTALPERLYSEKEFQAALYQVKNVYRTCNIDDINSKIKTTITFVVLKYITEQESIHRTLDKNVMLWTDWRERNIERDIKATIEDIQRKSVYSDVAMQLGIDPALTSTHCAEIKRHLEKFQYSGCNFDLYGAVYESFADKNMKKEFGEYYTRRHIAKTLSELLMRGELAPRKLQVCDPACGTGGFLTEAYRILLRNYTGGGYFTTDVNDELKSKTFFGFDIKEANISLARINMCLAGDGHTNISVTPDSLITLEEEKYDYVLTNVPYGDYKGTANVDNFTYAQKKRYENLFLEKVIKSLKYGGRAVIVIPDGILESPSLEGYRMRMLAEVKIDAVISLHKYVFRPYTTEKTYALILQRRQKNEVAKKMNYDVFMYILENDGFQKGDKRYPIRENNIPDLLTNYKTLNCEAPHTFINTANINESNFHNLTPEFYLNYYEGEYQDVNMDEYKEMIERLKHLNNVLENPFAA
ncbi:MAG: hypothetical protein POELPBGB_02423 [Bacteroidia bacterium]|nr:hypothetical protein [Bacteroidia bacterium]